MGKSRKPRAARRAERAAAERAVAERTTAERTAAEPGDRELPAVEPGADRVGAMSLVLTALPVLVAMFRILSMAHWDYTLVPVVLKSADFGAVAVSALFASLHVVAMVGMGLAVIGARKGLVKARSALFAIMAITALSTFLVPAAFAVLIIATSFMAVPLLRNAHPVSRPWKIGYAVLALIYSFSIVSHLSADGPYWLPAEVIETTDGRKLVAHVVESGDHDLTAIPVTREEPLIIRQDRITSRTLCRNRPSGLVGQAARLPIAVLVFDRGRPDSMPSCVVE
ncbi:hypothetical protein ACIQMJ_01010 [Actinosynnema sp. NPDC091369]